MSAKGGRSFVILTANWQGQLRKTIILQTEQFKMDRLLTANNHGVMAVNGWRITTASLNPGGKGVQKDLLQRPSLKDKTATRQERANKRDSSAQRLPQHLVRERTCTRQRYGLVADNQSISLRPVSYKIWPLPLDLKRSNK